MFLQDHSATQVYTSGDRAGQANIKRKETVVQDRTLYSPVDKSGNNTIVSECNIRTVHQ